MMHFSPAPHLPRTPARRTGGWRTTVVLVASVLALAISACGKSGDQNDATKASDDALPVAESPLTKAVIKGNLGEIREQLDTGAEVNSRDVLGRTPLHIAAFYGWPKTTELLIARGADVNARDRVGMTPLHAAVLSGGRGEVELLLRRKAEIGAKTDAGQSALHLSAATGQPRLTRYLLEQGAEAQGEDSNGKTPLFYAQQNQHPQTTAALQQYRNKADSANE